MRIEFAHADLPPLPWPDGVLRVGSAVDNEVRLDGAGVAGHHAVLTRDARGLVLEVCRGAGRVYVNARPVREKALLHCGDSLGIGACRLHLVADAVGGPGDPDVGVETASVSALRVVAGPMSGQVHALDEPVGMDADGAFTVAGREGTLLLDPRGRHVLLDAAGWTGGPVISINGREMRQALLADGDQVVMGAHRFVLDISADAPVPRPPAIAPQPSGPETVRRSHAHPEMWWLIATAAILALVLAGALLIHY